MWNQKPRALQANVRGASAFRLEFRTLACQPGILNRRNEVSSLSGDGVSESSQYQKEVDEESRAQKPSLLLRPALLVWFEVRVTRSVSAEVQKSA
jgi:hypothetical protein